MTFQSFLSKAKTTRISDSEETIPPVKLTIYSLNNEKSELKSAADFLPQDWKVNQVLDSDLLDISPSVDGKVVALSSNTLTFIPEKKLKPGTEYQVTLNLDKLTAIPKEKEKELSKFNTADKSQSQDKSSQP